MANNHTAFPRRSQEEERRRRRLEQGKSPHGLSGLLALSLPSFLLRAVAFLLLSSAFVNLLYHSRLPSPSPHLMKHGKETSLWKNSKPHQVGIKKDKKGRVVHESITAVKKEDLKGIGDDKMIDTENIDLEEVKKGREELLAILHDAGVDDVDASVIAKLPTQEQVTKLYGDGPVVYGLETCQRFRDTIPKDDASIGTAGLFNTGTNPFAMYLQSNCEMPLNKREKYRGMRWQVPWGKHMLAERKWTNTAGHDHKVNKTNVMPIVLIRDPYSWMQSMCKHPYTAKWKHTKQRCPNLVPSKQDRAKFRELRDSKTVPIRIKYPEKPGSWPSLVHLWSDWYNQYMKADYPRLIVRFEDLIFHQKELINIVCECAGAVPKQDSFSYVVDNGKWGGPHHGSSNMIAAMVKYGSDKHRFDSLTEEDLAFAADNLDVNLMKLFQYEIPTS